MPITSPSGRSSPETEEAIEEQIGLLAAKLTKMRGTLLSFLILIRLGRIVILERGLFGSAERARKRYSCAGNTILRASMQTEIFWSRSGGASVLDAYTVCPVSPVNLTLTRKACVHVLDWT